MSDYTVPDCLVLKLEEFDTTLKEIDTTIYILYDKKEHQYVIRGQRRVTPYQQSCTYSFNCEFAEDLVVFLKYLICKSNTVNEVLYNYDNLPGSSEEITFEFLKQHDDRNYEISGYNGFKFKRNRIVRILRMLRNVFNYYN